MTSKPKLLILNRSQFGYHIDTYYYCKYLADYFDITYLGWDYGNSKLKINGVNVIYISRSGPKLFRYIKFIKSCIAITRSSKCTVFIKYFPLCIFVKIFSPGNRYVLDVRTGYIIDKLFKRKLLNMYLRWEANRFSNITVISESLKKYLKLHKDKTVVIPLGADIISSSTKSFDDINLIYLGTFHKRNIEQTLEGFAKFYSEYGNKLKMSYTIIGSGFNNEEQRYSKLIKSYGIENVVHLEGSIPHNKLKYYFDRHNFGVSYIPITPYFQCQPPTKTFEYLLSGMPVIATSTLENERVMNKSNGVLIRDNAESFYTGLCQLVEFRDLYNSDNIRKNSESYLWSNIVHHNLKGYLMNLSD